MHIIRPSLPPPARPARRAAFALCLSIIGPGALFGAFGGDLPKDIEWYLTNAAGFAAADLADLESGKVLARVASSDQDAEIAVVAAVKIRASRDFVLQYYNQMISYVDGQATLQYGQFSRPPKASDVAALELPGRDIEDLKSCRPGDCDLKLGGSGIEQVRSRVNWQAPDYAAQVNALARQGLVAYVTRYLAQGDAALMTYDDQSKPVSLAAEWKSILANSTYFPRYAPALKQYFDSFPRGTLAGGRDTLYWVKESYGGRAILSAVHMVTYKDPQTPDRTFVAQKQIYASHYLEGSFAIGLIVGVQTGTAGRGVSYLIYVNRSRGDLLRGGFGGLRRNTVNSQARKAAEQTLDTIKVQLERALGL
jgi:hypothetical protein